MLSSFPNSWTVELQLVVLSSPSDPAALFKNSRNYQVFCWTIDFNHFKTQFLYIVLAVTASTNKASLYGAGGSRKRLVSITKALKVEADNLLTTQTFHVSVLAPVHKDDLINLSFPQRSNF